MRVKKQQLEPCLEQQTGSRLRKKYNKVVYYYPVYLTYTQSTSYEILGWMNQKLDINNNLSYTDDITLITESEEELKSLLMRMKEESKKAGLKLNIHKIKIMVFSPIPSWQIEGEKVEAVTDFLSLGSKIIADMTAGKKLKDAYSLEGKL